MRCPYCGSGQSFVINSREGDDGRYRRRQCTACGERFSTMEKPVFRSSAKSRRRNARCENLKDALTLAMNIVLEMKDDTDG